MTGGDSLRDAAALFALLANHNRLLLLRCLCLGPRSVTQLHGCVPEISQAALSQHLSLLRANRVVACDRQGQRTVYTLTDHRAKRMVESAEELFYPVKTG